ncbi:Hypothetical predicted protein [Paramuricea clavata]|uniref:Uncharacterized protein n=1 Tax=Paramuricea clavata TaxID=317549 RepID=A0A6S7JZR2_PARCT|nr:Hypothetical predicted protein [Paramuricea clavata]
MDEIGIILGKVVGGSIQCLESSEENSKFLTMRIISPTCELKPPVKDVIQNIEEQVQNLTTNAEIRELRQYLKDEIAKVQNTVEEILHILLNKTRKGECFMNGSILNPKTTSKSTYTSIQIEGKDCADLFEKGINASGVYKIDPDGLGSFNVFCDMTTSGGGWTVFQHRLDGSVDFYRGWQDYKQGFGNLDGEFWLGLDKIHRLTTAVSVAALRIDMEDTSGNKQYALYDSFAVADEQQKYKLSVGSFVGTAGDSFTYQNGMAFATKDADTTGNCAKTFKGAWWYRGCHYSNLNGLYHHGAHKTFADGINWVTWKGYHYSLKSTSMKIRRRPFGL